MDGAVFFTKLTAISKTSHAPGTAAAHLRYIQRKAAVDWELSEHFPEDYVERIKFMHRRESNSRKNAQVCVKAIINLPYSLTDEQRQAMVKDLCQQAGMGRIPYLAVAHKDTDSPHVHITFIDADIETGLRVFGFSKAGGLWRWRGLVETVENAHLEAAGTPYRVSRYGKDSKQHQELNEKARVQYEGQTKHQHAPRHSLETTALTAHLPPNIKEDTVAAQAASDKDFKDSVQQLLTAKAELRQIETAENALTQTEAKIQLGQIRAKDAGDMLSQLSKQVEERNAAAYAANVYYSNYHGVMAKLRKLFSKRLRGNATQAKNRMHAAMGLVDRANDAYERLFAEELRIKNELSALRATELGLTHKLSEIGDKQDREDMKRMHAATVWHNADRIEMFYKPRLDEALRKGEISQEAYNETIRTLENRRNNLMNKVAEDHEQQSRGYKH